MVSGSEEATSLIRSLFHTLPAASYALAPATMGPPSITGPPPALNLFPNVPNVPNVTSPSISSELLLSLCMAGVHAYRTTSCVEGCLRFAFWGASLSLLMGDHEICFFRVHSSQ